MGSFSSRALFSCLAIDLAPHVRGMSLESLCTSDSTEHPRPDADVREVACVWLRNSFFKKFMDEKQPDADQLALEDFLSANDRCKNFKWERNCSELDAICLGEWEASFYDSFLLADGEECLSLQAIFDGVKVGPGSSLSATGDSLYHKLASSTLSTTSSELYRLYKLYTDARSLWSEMEFHRHSHFGSHTVVPGNVVAFAPKTSRISRTVCTEPSLNMFFQQGIASCFTRQLQIVYHIDLEVQPERNKRLARIGSKYGTYGTIDLRSASNTIALSLVKGRIPPYVYSWLMKTRSPYSTLPPNKGGILVPMHMVASMGNAFTFPLQTLIFSAAVRAVYKTLGLPFLKPSDCFDGNFGVFGDDIVCLRQAYGPLCRLLTHLGFEVNLEKSFNEGSFRESCGGDYWLGENIRGVYLRSLKSPQDVYSAINRLQVWSANWDVPLPTTIRYLMRFASFLPVPPWESDVAGVKVPLALTSGKIGISRLGSFLYKRWIARPKRLNLTKLASRPLDVSTRREIYNPAGHLLVEVGGYARDGWIGIRTKQPQYKIGFAVAPGWDYVEPSQTLLTSVGWRRWVTTIAAKNLVNS